MAASIGPEFDDLDTLVKYCKENGFIIFTEFWEHIIPIFGMHPDREDVNSNRESERLLGYCGELGELLPWFAARAPA
jgi:hypothetical protein